MDPIRTRPAVVSASSAGSTDRVPASAVAKASPQSEASPAPGDAFGQEAAGGCSSGHVAACGCDAPADPQELLRALRTGAPGYFRSYEEMKAAMYALAEQYPELVEVVDIGDSWEKTQGTADRDILALRLTKKPAAGEEPADRPKTMWLGGMHAREIANPELLMRWAEGAVKGYGTDPELTAMLETREVLLVPMVNPDGHAVVERGYATQDPRLLDQRKNTRNGHGVDLNRNFDFRWGGPGASTSPSSPTYRGASAASEPEIQAVQGFALAERPDLFMDWHSHGELNLTPWGDKRDRPEDHQGLMAISNRFAADNRYRAIQSVDLYPASGTSKDWAYGTLGIPALTMETGRRFHQTDAEFEETWQRNAPVLTQSVKIADDPYARAKGPDAVKVEIAAGQIRAEISDLKSGGDRIQAVEWFTDASTRPGQGTRLQAEDGAFDEAEEVAVGTLSAPADAVRADGRVLIFVRAQDEHGNWGPATAQWLDAAEQALKRAA